MAKLIPYDNTGVEEGGGGTGVKIKPGVRIAKIVKAEHRTEKSDGSPANDIKVTLNFGNAYDWGYTYIGLSDAADWKLAEFTRALGMKEKGGIDVDKLPDKLLRIKVNPGTFDGQYSPDMGRLMKPLPGDDKLWEEQGKGGDGVSMVAEPEGDDITAAAAGDEPDDQSIYQPEYADGFEASRESDPEVGSYDDWNEEDLLAECEDRGLTLPGGRASKKSKALTALREEDALVEGGGDVPDDQAQAEADAVEGDDGYDALTLDELKTEWNSRSLGDMPKFRGAGAGDKTRTALIEGLRGDDGSDPFEQ